MSKLAYIERYVHRADCSRIQFIREEDVRDLKLMPYFPNLTNVCDADGLNYSLDSAKVNQIAQAIMKDAQKGLSFFEKSLMFAARQPCQDSYGPNHPPNFRKSFCGSHFELGHAMVEASKYLSEAKTSIMKKLSKIMFKTCCSEMKEDFLIRMFLRFNGDECVRRENVMDAFAVHREITEHRLTNNWSYVTLSILLARALECCGSAEQSALERALSVIVKCKKILLYLPNRLEKGPLFSILCDMETKLQDNIAPRVECPSLLIGDIVSIPDQRTMTILPLGRPEITVAIGSGVKVFYNDGEVKNFSWLDKDVHMVTVAISGDDIKEVFIQNKAILEGGDPSPDMERLSVIDEEDEIEDTFLSSGTGAIQDIVDSDDEDQQPVAQALAPENRVLYSWSKEFHLDLEKIVKTALDRTLMSGSRQENSSVAKDIVDKVMNKPIEAGHRFDALVRVLCGLCYNSDGWFLKQTLETWCQEDGLVPEGLSSMYKETLVDLLTEFVHVRISENKTLREKFVERKRLDGVTIDICDTNVCFVYDVADHASSCASETWLRNKLSDFLTVYKMGEGMRETFDRNIKLFLDNNDAILQNLLQTWLECGNDPVIFNRILSSQSQTRQAPVNMLTSFFSCFTREREGSGPCKFTFSRPSIEASNLLSGNRKTKVIVTVESDSEDDTIDSTLL